MIINRVNKWKVVFVKKDNTLNRWGKDTVSHNILFVVTDRPQTRQLLLIRKRQESCLSYEILWTGTTAIDIPAYMHEVTCDFETYQTESSICCKNCPDFLVKMNYLLLWGFLFPVAQQRYEIIINRTNSFLQHILDI